VKTLHYDFYFDETFHDRKITVSQDGMVNSLIQDKNDCYLGVFIGIASNKKTIKKQLIVLEDKYKHILGKEEEFKSTTFKRSNFTWGIKSFQKNTFDFYSEFFSTLEKNSLVIHVNATSKLELLFRYLFDISLMTQIPGVYPNSFYYSLTKFVYNYHSPALFSALYMSVKSKDYELFQNELLKHIKCAIEAFDGIERKKREIHALKQLYDIVSLYDFKNELDNKYSFIYQQIFDGLQRLLHELRIPVGKTNITIDQEEKTFNASRGIAFHSVRQTDSKNSIFLRATDHLCGFLGRFMYALMNDAAIKEDKIADISHLSEYDITRKHLLSSMWFDLQEKHFVLYKKIYKVLIEQQGSYWSTMTFSYSDQIVAFYSFLRYIASYESYSEYKTCSLEDHSERYNSACCYDLERAFRELMQ
jgi:hypothetical protein